MVEGQGEFRFPAGCKLYGRRVFLTASGHTVAAFDVHTRTSPRPNPAQFDVDIHVRLLIYGRLPSPAVRIIMIAIKLVPSFSPHSIFSIKYGSDEGVLD